MYEISEISTNLFKMYEYPMYCKMLGVGRRSILTKKNVCKSLVEPCRSILVRFSIFSIQLRFIVLYMQYQVLLNTVLVLYYTCTCTANSVRYKVQVYTIQCTRTTVLRTVC